MHYSKIIQALLLSEKKNEPTARDKTWKTKLIE